MRPEEEGEFGFIKQFIFDQRWLARQLVEDARFNQAFLIITILNTLVLALAYDGEPFRHAVLAMHYAEVYCCRCPMIATPFAVGSADCN